MKDTVIIEKEAIGEYLSKIRKEKGISKYKLIQDCELNMNIVDSIEKGSKAYTIDSLLRYAEGLGLKIVFEDK